MRRLIGFSLIVLCTTLLSSPLVAQPQPQVPTRFYDDLNVLPTGATVTEQDLMNHVVLMPAVQLAMADFQSRGYTRYTSGDYARVYPDSAFVWLQYESPNDSLFLPAIVVGTIAGWPTPQTAVLAGALQVNRVTEEITAVDIPNYAVLIYNMASTESQNYAITGDPVARRFKDFSSCFGWGCAGCFYTCLLNPYPPLIPVCFFGCCAVVFVICLFN